MGLTIKHAGSCGTIDQTQNTDYSGIRGRFNRFAIVHHLCGFSSSVLSMPNKKIDPLCGDNTENPKHITSLELPGNKSHLATVCLAKCRHLVKTTRDLPELDYPNLPPAARTHAELHLATHTMSIRLNTLPDVCSCA